VPVPDYSDPTPVRRQIADDLRVQIRAGRHAPGSRLPSNIALAKRYGVATETIRSALDELRAEKTVETRSTRGTFVTGIPPASPRPDLSAVIGQVAELADLTEDYPDLRARVGKMEAILINLHLRLGYPNPYEDGHDNAREAPRHGRAGRR
jgi:DNA-binding FadR family transcriptional regulator